MKQCQYCGHGKSTHYASDGGRGGNRGMCAVLGCRCRAFAFPIRQVAKVREAQERDSVSTRADGESIERERPWGALTQIRDEMQQWLNHPVFVKNIMTHGSIEARLVQEWRDRLSLLLSQQTKP